jgi:ribose 1,5-bisphosphokinase PhnN
MGLIINVRGTSGSGKTTLVRHVMTAFAHGLASETERILRPECGTPLAYRIIPPGLSRPLFVLGGYERSSGGCDTISQADGGLDAIFALTDAWARRGHAVLLEGVALSVEHERFSELAHRHDLRVLRLTTPLQHCARNLLRRRRQSQDTWPTLMPMLVAQHRAVAQACHALPSEARVLDVSFDLGLLCACNWLLRAPVPPAESAAVLPFQHPAWEQVLGGTA